MGGSISRGYGEDKNGAPRPPEPEWNIDVIRQEHGPSFLPESRSS